MKKLFWVGLPGLFLFEIANVYFIMPMPGSQQMNSIDAAYFLYKWRWVFRGLFGMMIIIGLFRQGLRIIMSKRSFTIQPLKCCHLLRSHRS